jgi:hypothetical protein
MLTTLPPSCADCLEIWELQPPGTLKACTGIAVPLYMFCICSAYASVFFVWRENNDHDYAFMKVNTILGLSNLSLYVRVCLQYPRTFSRMQNPRLLRDSIICCTGGMTYGRTDIWLCVYCCHSKAFQ